jgi:hypothetical protein
MIKKACFCVLLLFGAQFLFGMAKRDIPPVEDAVEYDGSRLSITLSRSGRQLPRERYIRDISGADLLWSGTSLGMHYRDGGDGDERFLLQTEDTCIRLVFYKVDQMPDSLVLFSGSAKIYIYLSVDGQGTAAVRDLVFSRGDTSLREDAVEYRNGTLAITVSRRAHRLPRAQDLQSISGANFYANNVPIEMHLRYIFEREKRFLVRVEENYFVLTFFNVTELPDRISMSIRPAIIILEFDIAPDSTMTIKEVTSGKIW